MVWWLSTVAVALYVAIRLLLVLRAKRGFKDFNNSEYQSMFYARLRFLNNF